MDQGGRIMRLHYEGILQERLDELGNATATIHQERLDDQIVIKQFMLKKVVQRQHQQPDYILLMSY